MNTATLSSKFQICIPKEIRESLHLKSGQQFIFLTKGDGIYLVPKRNISDLKGILTDANPKNYRDRKDRV